MYGELEEGGVPPEFSDCEWERIEAVDPVESSAELDAGERAALAVALELDDVVFLTDDPAAREFTQDQNIEVHGSIGVIALAYHRGVVPSDDAALLMRALQSETSLFITDAIVERGIKLLQSNSDKTANTGRRLFETIQRSEQNTELVNFREKRAESQQVEDKYLDVLEHAKNVQ